MCSEFELLAAVFVLVGSTQNGDYFLLGGKGDRTGNLGTRLLHSLNDFLCGEVDEVVVVSLELDSDFCPAIILAS